LVKNIRTRIHSIKRGQNLKNPKPPDPADAFLFGLKIMEESEDPNLDRRQKIEAFHRLISELEMYWINISIRIVC